MTKITLVTILVIGFVLATCEIVKGNPFSTAVRDNRRPARSPTSVNNDDMEKSETYWYGYQPRYYNIMNPYYNNDFIYRGFNQYNPYAYMQQPFYQNPYSYYF
ncbi:uncharacterized protein LOC134215323 [Armigeres subalbatus]|uniref:uncharacterized protein LOC134215323 n=1 Tax=Armigeres subalbatus TaxID=124917 RepID=UPI002ED36E6C